MDTKQTQKELIIIAADLLLRNKIPSACVEDYPQKTYSASRVAEMMEPAHRQLKDVAVRLRKVVDLISAEAE